MAEQENRGRGILPITTPQREGAAPVLPKPGARPAPEASLQPKKGKEKKGTGKKARIALAGLAVAGTGYVGGAIVNEQINDMPLSTRSVVNDAAWPWNLGKSAAEDIAGMLHKEPPSAFDNSEVKGEISSANILYIPKEVFDKTPLADENGAPIFDFPWDKKYPDIKMRYEKSLWPRPDWWKSGGVDVDPNTNIKNSFAGRDSLPAGFELRTPYPGRLFWSGSVYDEEASRKSPSNPYGLAVYSGPIHLGRIEFIAPNGVFYAITISINKIAGGGGSLALEPLIDAPLTGLENGGGRDWEKGTLVERGQPIFRTTKEGKLSMNIGGSKNKRDGLFKDTIPGNFIFQTGKDAVGTQKLLVSDAK